jgi:hypothetical protein
MGKEEEAEALTTFAPHLPDPSKRETLLNAFHAAWTCDKPGVLKNLGPHLPKGSLSKPVASMVILDRDEHHRMNGWWSWPPIYQRIY